MFPSEQGGRNVQREIGDTGTFAGDGLWDPEGMEEGLERAGAGSWHRLAGVWRRSGAGGPGWLTGGT